ncbi:MAG: hypothetical protein N2321_09525 [Melioribacteraceae bacterium]|nr:hypothetical protein [Melioribacteraceae bacterium]
MKKFLLILFLISTISKAQTFGFGCLGLSGIYAGVSEYKYDVQAINNFLLKEKLSVNEELKFERGTGYRIGANLFRAKWEGFFISAKGYYQFIKEEKISKQSFTKLNELIQSNKNFQLKLNNWALGIDFGTPIFKVLDWKILEGHISYFTPEFNIEYYENNNFIEGNKFEPEKMNISYFVGSGLILHLVQGYFSIEGTAGYNFLKVEHFKNQNNIIIGDINNYAVKNAGWSYTLQINVGFPF